MNPPEPPPGLDEPVFAEPWQAQVFAMTVALNEAGVFTWSEWAQSLSREVHRPGAQDGSDYYACWVAALERLLFEKGIALPDQIAGMAEAWQRAAHATPHGRPIVLENDPERSGARPEAGRAGTP